MVGRRLPKSGMSAAAARHAPLPQSRKRFLETRIAITDLCLGLD